MRTHRRSKGNILQPDRFSPAVVRGLKQKSREWSGQYQQEPHPASGIIFQPDWWKFYKARDPLPEFDVVALSVDCAFKSAAQNDYVCLQKWGAVGPRSYLLEMITMHLGYAATKAMIRALQQDGLHASVILVEDKANGSAVIEELRADDFGASVIAINPEGGKESRAYAASADCEAGNVYLPADADWLAGFLRTAAAFPAVKHDDQIDALTQFLNWRRTRTESLGYIELLERRAKQIAEGIRDVFGELIHKVSQPKRAPFAVRKEVAGPRITRVEGNKGQAQKPECPVCKTNALSVRVPVAGGWQCNACQNTFDAFGNVTSQRPSPSDVCPNGPYPGAPHSMTQWAGGRPRCQYCGFQPTGEPQAIGISRGAYLSGVKKHWYES